jgi:hypothetical protein
VTWEFWLVGDEIDDAVDELTHKTGQPDGLYQDGRNYRIWVRSWAEILEENRQRLHFYRDHLDYKPGEDTNLEATLSKYLAPQTAFTDGQDDSDREEVPTA